MRFQFLAALLLGMVCPGFSQISGTVTHQVTRLPLNQANLILAGEHNTPVLRTGTDAQGNFLFAMPPAGNYRLSVSYLGFTAKHLSFKVTANTEYLILDSIALVPAPLDLNAISVKAAKPLVSLRGDTVEFNASDFYTAEKASLLNLFQKVPGLTIDVDGNFYFQGTPIHDLYIDGRPAFQNAAAGTSDPKILSRLLQASLVDKIQLTSKDPAPGLSLPAKQKIINITLKKESKKGVNAEIGLGYGSEGALKAAGSAARFRDHSQIIGIASVSNVSSVNPPGSSDESTDMNSRFPGTTRDTKLAVNTGFDAGTKNKFNISFTHMDRNEMLSQDQRRENFLPDSSYFYNSNSTKNNRMKASMFNTNFSHAFNERNNLTLRADIFITNSNSTGSNQYQTLGENAKDTINFGNLLNSAKVRDRRSFFYVEYTRQFKTGGLLRLSANFDLDHNSSAQYNYSLAQLPAPEVPDTINQLVQPQSRNANLLINGMLFKPLGKKFHLQLVYNITGGRINNRQVALNYNYQAKKYAIVDSVLSYQFRNNAFSQVFNPSVTYRKGKFNTSFGATLGISEAKSSGSSSVLNSRQYMTYVSPVLTVGWSFNNMTSIRVEMSNSPLFPITSQLVPVISVQNPLVVQLGNPDLKPGYSRRLSLDLSYMTPHGTSLNAGAFATFEYNSVSTSVYIDSIGRQVSKPVNVNGVRALSPTLSFGRRFQHAGLSIAYRAFGDLRRAASFINGQQSINRSVLLIQDFSVTWNCKQLLELSANAQLSYRGNKYDLQNDPYYHFMDQRIFLKAGIFLPAEFQLGTAAMYINNTSNSRPFTLLNGWISKLLAKNWLIKIYGFDLLRQNRAQTAQLTSYFFDRTFSNSQEQYFMCSLTRYFK